MSDDKPSRSKKASGTSNWFVVLFAPNGSKPKDRELHAKGHAIAWLVCLALLGAMFGLSLLPNTVERYYTETAGQAIGRFLAAISGVFPFSLIEFLIAAILLWIVFFTLRAAVHFVQRKRRLLNAVAAGLVQIVTLALVLVTYFYAAWGLNYARAGLIERLGWEEGVTANAEDGALDAVDTEELAGLCAELVASTNAAYAELHGSEDRGKPTEIALIKPLDRAIDRAYEQVGRQLSLHPTFVLSRGLAKPVAASIVMCHLRICGFYNPWTGEANYNWMEPDAHLPHTIAHEKAHQRGVTSEDEANFFGYLACSFSDAPAVRYSGLLFAQEQLLRELDRLDKERVKTLVALRYPGVQRDLDEDRAFWSQFQGKAGEVSRAFNNAYLKMNRVKGGVMSYRMSSKLLVLYARRNHNTFNVPETP